MDGLLTLWKERGMTSHDCVFKLRKILHTKKIGHGGTLDPDVDGVLPICIGKATKVIEYLTDSGKIYVGEITLGFSTTTEDRSGERVETKPVDMSLSEEKIDEVMASFIGEITQIPPMYSAVKSTVSGYMNMPAIMKQWSVLLERLRFTVLSGQVN